MNCSNGCGNNNQNGHWVEEEICLSPELIKSWYEYNPNTNVLTDKEKKLIEKAAKDGVVLGHGLTDVERDLLAAIILGGGVYSKVEVTSLLGTKINSSVGLGLSANDYTDADKLKLSTLNASGGNQTDMQIKVAYERNSDTNSYTDAEKIKLQNMEGSHFKGVYVNLTTLALAYPATTCEAGSYAYINDGVGNETMVILDDIGDTWIPQVQSSATPLTGTQIKALYEAEANTNVFTDGEKTKLANAITSLPPVIDITGKVDKVVGKQLSTEDYTTAEKTKLAGLSGSHFKGTHVDEATLLLAHPTAEPGSYAYVMDTHNHEQMYVWDDTTNLWENLGHTSAVHMTDAQVKTQYESNPDTNALTDGDLAKIGTALQTHQSLAGLVVTTPGKDLSSNDYTSTEKTKLGNIPDVPTTDGEYVLTVIGGVSTWGLNSGGASVYDAHILGTTLSGNITLSPFIKHGGTDEEIRNRGVDFADGGIYLVYPMYQAGMSAAHIGDTSPMFLADDYANASPVELFNGAGTSMGNPFTGKQMNAAIAAGSILQIQYDSSSSKLLVEVT